MGMAPDHHPKKVRGLGLPGTSFFRRFQHLGKLADLDESIRFQRQAINLAIEGHPDKPASRQPRNFSCQFQCLRELTDLNGAVVALQQVVNLVPNTYPDRSGYSTSEFTAVIGSRA